LLLDQFCPECAGPMLYDAGSKRFSCKKCGLFLTREQLSDLRYKLRNTPDSESRARQRQQADYLDWWLKDKKDKK
jgi:ribosomal protein S27AE